LFSTSFGQEKTCHNFHDSIIAGLLSFLKKIFSLFSANFIADFFPFFGNF